MVTLHTTVTSIFLSLSALSIEDISLINLTAVLFSLVPSGRAQGKKVWVSKNAVCGCTTHSSNWINYHLKLTLPLGLFDILQYMLTPFAKLNTKWGSAQSRYIPSHSLTLTLLHRILFFFRTQPTSLKPDFVIIKSSVFGCLPSNCSTCHFQFYDMGVLLAERERERNGETCRGQTKG